MSKRKYKDTDETKNRKTLRQAAYQYVLDHSYPTPKGLVVNFFLPKKQDFFRKLEAREYREYIRVQNEEQYLDYPTWYHQYKKMSKSHEWQKMMSQKNEKLQKEGGLYVRLLYKIKTWAQKRINKRLEKITL